MFFPLYNSPIHSQDAMQKVKMWIDFLNCGIVSRSSPDTGQGERRAGGHRDRIRGAVHQGGNSLGPGDILFFGSTSALQVGAEYSTGKNTDLESDWILRPGSATESYL